MIGFRPCADRCSLYFFLLSYLPHSGIPILSSWPDVRSFQQGKHELAGTTLAYMPHCDRELQENFLQANWRISALTEQLLLIGNDLRGYTDK